MQPLTLKITPAPSSTPLSLTLTLTNPSSTTVTLLTWSTPIDPLALQLGLLSFTHTKTNTAIPINKIMLKRRTPPSDDQFVTIQPGGSASQSIAVIPPAVDLSGLEGERVLVQWAGGDVKVWDGEDVDDWEGGKEVGVVMDGVEVVV
ncbi:hypothetical protein OQA88_11604 [Cercophora sp. LCS_1]